MTIFKHFSIYKYYIIINYIYCTSTIVLTLKKKKNCTLIIDIIIVRTQFESLAQKINELKPRKSNTMNL